MSFVRFDILRVPLALGFIKTRCHEMIFCCFCSCSFCLFIFVSFAATRLLSFFFPSTLSRGRCTPSCPHHRPTKHRDRFAPIKRRFRFGTCDSAFSRTFGENKYTTPRANWRNRTPDNSIARKRNRNIRYTFPLSRPEKLDSECTRRHCHGLRALMCFPCTGSYQFH